MIGGGAGGGALFICNQMLRTYLSAISQIIQRALLCSNGKTIGGRPQTIDIRLEGIGNRARAPYMYISIERTRDTPGSC